MSAGSRDIQIEIGADFIDVIRIEDEQGQPLENLEAGWLVEMQVRENIDDSEILIHAISTNSTITLSVNIITIHIPYSVTELITSKKGVYDIELTSPSDIRTRLVEGKVYFSKNVTR